MTERFILTVAQDYTLIRMVFIIGQAEHIIDAIDLYGGLVWRNALWDTIRP
jgi:hypothetical protein